LSVKGAPLPGKRSRENEDSANERGDDGAPGTIQTSDPQIRSLTQRSESIQRFCKPLPFSPKGDQRVREPFANREPLSRDGAGATKGGGDVLAKVWFAQVSRPDFNQNMAESPHMNLVTAYKIATTQNEGGTPPLRVGVDILTDLIADHPEMHREIAAALVVLFAQPGLQVHMDIWKEDNGEEMSATFRRLAESE
jgi:hypothetical protein